jgi:hypothetical protein
MDWIERIFGIAPDNGDGTLELLLTLSAVAAVAIAALAAHPRTRAAIMRFFGQLGLGEAGPRSH